MLKELIKAVILRLKEINGMNSAKSLLVCDNSLIHSSNYEELLRIKRSNHNDVDSL